MKAMCYVAGPYRSFSLLMVVRNIFRAWSASRSLMALGVAPVCPHSMYALMDLFGTNVNDIISADNTILSSCDMLLVLRGWEGSSGTLAEIKFADKLGIPVFYNIKDAVCFANDLSFERVS
jgi:nucleoside 2-deoxyribosyltransferase